MIAGLKKMIMIISKGTGQNSELAKWEPIFLKLLGKLPHREIQLQNAPTFP